MFENKIPLYFQLAKEINSRIDTQIYPEGTPIPSERELCEEFNVSRMTVRLAITELEKLGRIEKIQGKGTFVKKQTITSELNKVYSFSQEMEKQNKISRVELLEIEVIEADLETIKNLGLKDDIHCIYLKRLRQDKENNIMIERTYFPMSYKFLLDIDFNKVGLYRTLEERQNIKIDRIYETFRARQLTSDERKILGNPHDPSGIYIKRKSYCKGELICFSTIIARGDLFEFKIEVNTN